MEEAAVLLSLTNPGDGDRTQSLCRCCEMWLPTQLPSRRGQAVTRPKGQSRARHTLPAWPPRSPSQLCTAVIQPGPARAGPSGFLGDVTPNRYTEERNLLGMPAGTGIHPPHPRPALPRTWPMPGGPCRGAGAQDGLPSPHREVQPPGWLSPCVPGSAESPSQATAALNARTPGPPSLVRPGGRSAQGGGCMAAGHRRRQPGCGLGSLSRGQPGAAGSPSSAPRGRGGCPRSSRYPVPLQGVVRSARDLSEGDIPEQVQPARLAGAREGSWGMRSRLPRTRTSA